jgi:hypothetical protein
MRKLAVYDPAMCCPSGMCGVSIDPEIIRIATLLHALKKHNIEVKRYNLSSNPMEFVSQQAVNTMINEKGIDCLPLTVLDDVIVFSHRYPTNVEVMSLLGLPISLLNDLPRALNVGINTV